MAKKKRRRSRNNNRLFINLILLAALVGLFLWTNAETKRQQNAVSEQYGETEQSLEEVLEDAETTEETEVTTKPSDDALQSTEAEEEVASGNSAWTLTDGDLSGVQSEAILVYDQAADAIIYEKNADAARFPASLTKIMTVLVAVENLTDAQLEEKTVIRPDVFWAMAEQNASMSGFSPDEEVKVKDLLYAAMLPSGGDATQLLAEIVGGSEEGFVTMMNQKAQELGMTETHFVNPSGLHDPEHTMSAKDTMTLLRYAMDQDKFEKLFTTASYRTEPTNMHPEGVTIRSSMMKLLVDQPEQFRFIGGKTGFTEQAGLALASITKVDGREFYLVTMGAPYQEEQRNAVYDHIRIMESLIAANE